MTARPKLRLGERFWRKVEIASPDECWIWAASTNHAGYGQFNVQCGDTGGCELAHRVVWKLYRGSIPEGMCVLHRCDNPPCVNPSHLFLGSHADNMRDMAEKGRYVLPQLRGEGHHQAKLTEEQVRIIRRLSAQGGVSYAALGRRFGVSDVAIRLIVRRETWQHV